MKVPVEVKPVEMTACDECGAEAVVKCYFCGKDLCGSCIARVLFYYKEMVRDRETISTYDKFMCKSHIPEKRSCE